MALDKVERTVIFGGLGIVAVLVLLFGAASNTSQPTQTPPEKKAEDERSQRIALAATMAQALKKSMRDPDSFKLSSVIIMDKGAVCYEYRAHNGFGGVNVGHAVFSPKGAFKTDEMDGFHTLWKNECAHKTGDEEVSTVSYLLDHAPSS